MVIGAGRRQLKIEDMLSKQGVKVSESQQKLLYPRCIYMKAKDPEDFKKIDEAITKYAAENKGPDNRVFFFSLPPYAYSSTSAMVKDYCYSKSGFTRCILEKPFGRDSKSFNELAEATSKYFTENELYRIDHYLGKEVVLNLFPLRFANQIFEPLWNSKHIESVYILWKEDLNTMGRGGYFDKYGIIRDIIQNHLLQVLIFVAMDKPKANTTEDIQEKKLQLLKSIKTLKIDDVLLGQFTARKYCRFCKDVTNPGYLDDETVPKDSKVPTYAMIKMQIDNERWKGVPFLVSAGKALNERKCEVRIRFRESDAELFKEAPCNELVIRIQPDEAIYFKVNVKEPGLSENVVNQVLDMSYSKAFDGQTGGDAYERMLLNCAKGEQQLFVGTKELVEAWRIFTPLLHEIDAKKPQPILYPFGSSAPKGFREFAGSVGIPIRETWQEFFALHAKEKKQLKKMFTKYANKDGELDTKNVKALLTEFYDGREPTEDMIQSFLKVFDENSDGVISWKEFRRGAHVFMPWTATRRMSLGSTSDFFAFSAPFGE